MELQKVSADYTVCRSCRRAEGHTTIMTSSCRLLLFTVALSLYSSQVSAQTETLCGGELVDTLQFVCGDRGFYFSRPYRTNGRRPHKGIVEECCFQACSLHLLEQYCAKPAKSERDISATTLHVVPVLQTLHKDSTRKPFNLKLSSYYKWQRTAAQRLRRGIPPILRSRKFKRLAMKIQNQEQPEFHRPLMTVSNRSPQILQASRASLSISEAKTTEI